MIVIISNMYRLVMDRITASTTATAVINLSTTAIEQQQRFFKIPQSEQEPQPRFSENSQPIHHSFSLLNMQR